MSPCDVGKTVYFAIKVRYLFIICWVQWLTIPCLFGQGVRLLERDSNALSNSHFTQFLAAKTTFKNHLKTLNSLENNVFPSKKLQKPRVNIGLTNLWTDGDSLAYGTSGSYLYTSLDANVAVTVFDIPITLAAKTVFQNENWRKDLSTFQVNLDYNRYLEKKKEALRQQILSDQMKKWSKEELLAYKNKLNWDVLHEVVNEKSFKEEYLQIDHQLDSLRGLGKLQLKDSLQLEKLETAKANYDKAKLQYQELMKYYRFNSRAMETADKLKRRLETEVYSAERLGKDAEKQIRNAIYLPNEKRLDKVMNILKDVKVGTFYVDGSDFTTQNISINGFQVKTRIKNTYNEVAVGRQNLSNLFVGSFTDANVSNQINRNIYFYRSGWHTKSDSTQFYLTLQRVIDNGSSPQQFWQFGTRQRSKINDVVAANFQTPLTKYFLLEGNVAYSFSVADIASNLFTGGGSDLYSRNDSPKKAADFSAFQVQLKPQIGEKMGFECAVAYGMVGDAFQTLGNPFLLNNRQFGKLEIAKKWRTLQIKVGVDKQIGANNDPDALAPPVNQTAFFAHGNWNYLPKHNLSVQVMPQYYFVRSNGQVFAMRYNMYALTHQIQVERGQRKWISLLSLTNVNHLQRVETVQTQQQLNYLFLQQHLLFSQRWTAQMTGNLGWSNGGFQQGFGQLELKRTFKLPDLGGTRGSAYGSLGGQYVAPSRFQTVSTANNDPQIGCILGGGLHWGNWQIGVLHNVRFRLSDAPSPTRIQSGQSFVRVSF
ncbi:MAG: hypothetical protein RL757_382 [Bacteroidota bacterium]|jgi:hypothetical protein